MKKSTVDPSGSRPKGERMNCRRILQDLVEDIIENRGFHKHTKLATLA